MGTRLITLGETQLYLYPSDVEGEALAGAPLFFGACAEGVRIGKRVRMAEVWGSGKRNAFRNEEGHWFEIGIERLWTLPTVGLQDFRPGRNQRYVLVLVWQEEEFGRSWGAEPAQQVRRWHRRSFFGVAAEEGDWSSSGQMQFVWNQGFTAERDRVEAGNTAYTPLAVPMAGVGELMAEQYLYPHGARLAAGSYLLGHYGWPSVVEAAEARFYARASQGADTVLGLEVCGVLRGTTVTLPAGAENAVVSGLAELSEVIGANEVARWKVVSGPVSTAEQAWEVGVVMRVRRK